MGRRKKEKLISKDHVINFRLTELEYYLLKESAEKADMTPSAYLRHLIVHRKVDYHYTWRDILCRSYRLFTQTNSGFPN